MLMKSLSEKGNSRVAKHILTIATNLSTNPANITKLTQKGLFDILLQLLLREVTSLWIDRQPINIFRQDNEHLGSIAKGLAGLSSSTEVKLNIVKHHVLKLLISRIHMNDPETQKMVAYSIK